MAKDSDRKIILKKLFTETQRDQKSEKYKREVKRHGRKMRKSHIYWKETSGKNKNGVEFIERMAENFPEVTKHSSPQNQKIV